MHQILGAYPRTAACIQNVRIVLLWFSSRAKAIGRLPVPAPVVARRRLIQQRFWWKGVGIVEFGDSRANGLRIWHGTHDCSDLECTESCVIGSITPITAPSSLQHSEHVQNWYQSGGLYTREPLAHCHALEKRLQPH